MNLIAKGLKIQREFPFLQEVQQAIKIYEILSLWSEKNNNAQLQILSLLNRFIKKNQKMQISNYVKWTWKKN